MTGSVNRVRHNRGPTLARVRSPPNPTRNSEKLRFARTALYQSSWASRSTAQAGFFILSQSGGWRQSMIENRNGFVVEAELRRASGMAERETAKDMVVRYSPGAKRLTVGADKGFDAADFVADMRDFNVTPHVAQDTTNRLSAIDHRTTRHCGYEISQQKRKRVEEPFGWGKTIGGLARPMLRGVKKLDFKFTLTMAAYDLIKLPRLIGAAT